MLIRSTHQAGRTGLRQLAAHAARGLSRTRIGSSVINAARTAAGLYFDAFQGHYKTEGMVFAIPREHTTRRMRGRFAVDSYELPERMLAKRHLPPGSRVLELGGCIGVLSCVVNHLLDSPTCHVVVEANRLLIPTLEHNRHVNHAAFRIENCVVSRKASAGLVLHRNMDSSYVDGRGIPVVTRTLEALEAAHAMAFDAVIMDIEGGEAAFIADHLPQLRRLGFLMIEFHPDSLGDAEVGDLRAALQGIGLHQIDRMLTTEVYVRRQAA
jgi:FkbM family methyltransferase